MVHGVVLIAIELAAVLEHLARVRLEDDVHPELFVAAPPRVLSGNTFDRGHAVDREAERRAIDVGDPGVQQCVSDGIERRLL